jgi:hypothetical protein
MNAAPIFVITTGPRLSGARLSSPGHWGNRPFPSIEAAEQEALRIGGPRAAISRERGR